MLSENLTREGHTPDVRTENVVIWTGLSNSDSITGASIESDTSVKEMSGFSEKHFQAKTLQAQQSSSRYYRPDQRTCPLLPTTPTPEWPDCKFWPLILLAHFSLQRRLVCCTMHPPRQFLIPFRAGSPGELPQGCK